MAKQDGVISLIGTIGELSFYKTRDGYFARKKTTIPGARVKSDPAFERTRQNAAEFAIAARAGKLLRTSFHPMMINTSDSRVTSRLAGALVKVVRADSSRLAGKRAILAQHTSLLEGFNFNRRASLEKILRADYTASINRATNSFSVNIPSFDPEASLSIPTGATHFRLTAGCIRADFKAGTSESTLRTVDLPLNATTPSQLSLHGKIPGNNSPHPVFLALSIEFLQQVCGITDNLHNSGHNAMAIVGVDGAADAGPTEQKEASANTRPALKRKARKSPPADRVPIARPALPPAIREPATLMSIVTEVLKSPDILNRIDHNQNDFNVLSSDERAALGLARILPLSTAATASRREQYWENGRDGPNE